MIDLKKFDDEFESIVPVVHGVFQLNRKRYKVSCDDGWRYVRVKGNEVVSTFEYHPTIDEFPKEVLKTINGYSYNHNIVFRNFEPAKRKYDKEVMDRLYFYTGPTFYPVIGVVWEDGKIYFLDNDYSDTQIYFLHEYLETGTIKDIKGLTPELKTVFMFHKLEAEHQKQLLAEAEKKQKEAEFAQSLPGRLFSALSSVDAELLRYGVEGKRVVVEWRIKGSAFEYNSVLDIDTFAVLEAGYCMSRDDNSHSLVSMVLTAQEWEEEGLIYITRRRDV